MAEIDDCSNGIDVCFAVPSVDLLYVSAHGFETGRTGAGNNLVNGGLELREFKLVSPSL